MASYRQPAYRARPVTKQLPGASDIAKNANGKKRGQPDHAINNNENENPPSAKKQKQSPTANSGKKVDAKKTDTKKDSSKDEPSFEDLSAIKLPNGDQGQVPIFDTCDDIRKKINDHLHRLPHATQAAFARTLTAMLPGDEKVESRHLATFLKGKGPQEGGQSPAFYAAYVYFEKVRVLHGKAKSKKRQDMEGAWEGEGGFPRRGTHNLYITCVGGERPSFDRLGQLKITGNPDRPGISRKKVH